MRFSKSQDGRDNCREKNAIHIGKKCVYTVRCQSNENCYMHLHPS